MSYLILVVEDDPEIADFLTSGLREEGFTVEHAPDDTPAHVHGAFVALTVADTGVGIAPDILPRVFDPFFTTKDASKGSGLGLSQVHGFAHQSGGTVTIESRLNEGTRVTLYLPRAQAAQLHARPERPDEQTGGGTVLLVEDNPDVAEVSAQMIEGLGYTVHTADGASAALALFDRVPFTLVVTDIVMAGSMDGVALAQTLRKRKADLPIVLVTGYSDRSAPPEREFPMLRKPFQVSDLSHAVASAIAACRAPGGNVVNLDEARRGPVPGPKTT